ncbi:MAG: hypothetical protein K0Q66_2243 [Chitinophagaceae bacterium]|nr:hypothetical protein [Chitinophagaceae bacterium]
MLYGDEVCWSGDQQRRVRRPTQAGQATNKGGLTIDDELPEKVQRVGSSHLDIPAAVEAEME